MAKRKRPSTMHEVVEGHPLWHELVERQSVMDGRVMCPLCDRMWPREFANELSTDHILAIKHGGTDDIDNLQLVCPSCNRIKGTKSNAEARALCLRARTMTKREWRIYTRDAVVARHRAANPVNTSEQGKARGKKRRALAMREVG